MGSLVADATTDYIRRSADVPQYTAASMCGWYKAASGVKAAGVGVQIAILGSSSSYGPAVRTDGALGVKTMSGSVASVVASGNWSEEEWLFITMALSAGPTQVLKYYDSSGTLLGTSSRTDSQTPTWTVMNVAGNTSGGSAAAGKYAYWKSWDATLNDTEFGNERLSPTFVRTANANCGFADSETDIGPNGRDWTRNSMDFDADDPLFNFDESLQPNSVTLTNLSGAYTDIDDDPDAPDGSWLTA